jgi:hypothetical protein
MLNEKDLNSVREHDNYGLTAKDDVQRFTKLQEWNVCVFNLKDLSWFPSLGH